MISLAFKDVLATSASICTILQFLAGILVCKKFVAHGTTGEASGLPFVTCFMSCSLWLRYGFLIGDLFIVFVNVFGTALQLCYVIVFALYSKKKTIILRQFTLALAIVVLIYLYCNYETDKTAAAYKIGFVSCTLTILFFASPLTMLAQVIRTKSSENLPYPIILSTFIVSCQWFIYGCILGDPFIQTPNFIGCVLSAFQLSLFIVYSKKAADQVRLI